MEYSEKIEFKKIRDFGGILTVTFDFIRQNFKKLFLSQLFIAGPAIILYGILSGFNQSNILEQRTGSILGLLGLSYLILILTAHLVITAGYSFIDLYLERTPGDFDINDVWDRVKNYFWSFLLTSIVTGILVILGTLLLIIPGIYLSVMLSIIYMIRMREDLSISDSLSRCKNLIQGHWWFTFGLLIVLYLIYYLFSFVLSIPAWIIMFINLLHAQDGNSVFMRFLTIIVTIISSFSFIFLSVLIIGVAFHYFSLVESKEATGLFEKLDSLDTQI